MQHLILVLALLLGSFGNAIAQNPMTYVKTDKNPGEAFTRALLIPGSGQMYNDQVELGFAVFVGVPLMIGGGVVTYAYTGTPVAISYLMIGIGGLAYLGSVIHAPLESRKINRKNGDTAWMEGSSRQPPVLSVGFNATGPGLALTF